MDANLKKANKLKIEKVIKNLTRRNMTGYYCETSEEAIEQIMALTPEGSVVSWGGSVTLDQLGVKEKFKEGPYEVNDPNVLSDAAENFEAKRQALLSDVYLMSTNAITMDGELVNIDGRGNRVAAMVFGPNKVIIVAGANKIVYDEKDAVDRIKNDACPPNCLRLGRTTPCAVEGKCGNCLNKGNTICCHTVTTRFSFVEDRIHVILINENLGY